MIGSEEIRTIIDRYDTNNITIGVLGSHCALDVCRGAKDEGFATLVVCEKGREKTYSQYYKTSGSTGIVDEVIVLEKFNHILDNSVQQKLRDKNIIFVPNRSFEVYLNFDYETIENRFFVPLFGNRFLLKAEERNQKNNQYDLLKKSHIRMPKIFDTWEAIDQLCLVKIPEKTRTFERSFFVCSSPQEFEKIMKTKIDNNEIDQHQIHQAVIEEFIIGSLVNFNYFYSPLSQRVELLGTDIRKQTNLDGFLRLTADMQLLLKDTFKPKFEEAGHIAVTVLESLLEKVFDLGEKFTTVTQQEYAPGIIGPFALQSMITPGPPHKDITVFDVSLRMPGSPGIMFTPYTYYQYGMALSAGRRIAMEIKRALKENRLQEVVT